MLYPRDPVPPFRSELVNGGSWDLAERTPTNFAMIVVYRSFHCPICKLHLTALNERAPELESLGLDILVTSADTRERAERAREEWGLTRLTIGHSLDFAMGHSWGLYISDKRSEAEPALFFEPGLFLVKPDLTLFYTSIQNMPFGRPEWGQLIMALNRILELDIPARGQVKLPHHALETVSH